MEVERTILSKYNLDNLLYSRINYATVRPTLVIQDKIIDSIVSELGNGYTIENNNPEPLIKKVRDKYILNPEKKNKPAETNLNTKSSNESSNDLALNNDGHESYEELRCPANRMFCNPNEEDDCYYLTITRSGEVSLFEYGMDSTTDTKKGQIVNDKITFPNNSDLHLKYEPYIMSMQNKKGKWIDYYEMKKN